MIASGGALSIAGMKAAIAGDKLKGKTLVAVASGANMNFDRLRYIAERAELGEKREAVLAVTIPETPGSFKTFCGLLGARSITEFNYRIARAGGTVYAWSEVLAKAEAIMADLPKKSLGRFGPVPRYWTSWVAATVAMQHWLVWRLHLTCMLVVWTS